MPRSGHPVEIKEDKKLKLIAFYCQTKPFNDKGRWSLRFAEKHLHENPNEIGFSPSKSLIQTTLKAHNLKPHLSKYFLHISDPNFFIKMEKLIELYKNPPKNLFSFDESPNIQILQRLVPDQQTEANKKRIEEFEYIRNGTLDLFACLEVSTGKVFSECKPIHDTINLVAFLDSHIKTINKEEEIHYIMDNLSTHSNYKTCQLIAKRSNIECPLEIELDTQNKRIDWLTNTKKRIMFHFTPLHGSWLNQIEIWFGIIGQKCFKESFASPEAMLETINEFVDTWNSLHVKPFKWNYTGEGLENQVVKRFIKSIKSLDFKNIELRVFTNQIKLLTNMYHNLYNKVEQIKWNELINIFCSKINYIEEFINEESGPIRKKKAIIAFEKILSIFNPIYKSKNA